MARKWVRPLRGGSRPHLFLAEDGHYYAVKAQDNPQGSQILVNEFVCYQLLRRLGFPVPDCRLVSVPNGLIGHEVTFSRAGIHFGSRYPVDPKRDAVFTHVSGAFLERTANRAALVGMVAFDKWVSNGDCRQAIFFRDRGRRWLRRNQDAAGPSRRKDAYALAMIDNGFAFQAEQWTFVDLPRFGFYHDRSIYGAVQGLEDFEPWLSRIREIPRSVVETALCSIPEQWLQRRSTRQRLKTLLDGLMERREKIPKLIEESRWDANNPFPAWRGARGAYRQARQAKAAQALIARSEGTPLIRSDPRPRKRP